MINPTNNLPLQTKVTRKGPRLAIKLALKQKVIWQ